MAGQENIHLEPEYLLYGAGLAKTAAANLRTISAAADVALEGNPFGLLCSPLLLAYHLLKPKTADLCNAAAAEIEEQADGLQETGLAFYNLDDANRTSIEGMGSEL
ncbi:MAG: hypothetical protein LBR21_01695 [Propionibacteriaceae bacterium]|jgi:hypothetical protein|nr:hypothetical protein [Propionibacteriaceae bacterium]